MSYKLADMMNVEDHKTHVAVQRAVNQIGHALKDYGLYVTIDPEGMLGVARLPADFDIKDERVCDKLQRVIRERHIEGRPVTALRLSDEHAKKLAAELAELQLDYARSESSIYASLVSGNSRFMDLPVTVTY